MCNDIPEVNQYAICGFKHVYLSSIAKQVLATYINHFQVHLLEPTRTGVYEETWQ
jgi:hypothetical protein